MVWDVCGVGCLWCGMSVVWGVCGCGMLYGVIFVVLCGVVCDLWFVICGL